MVKSLARSTTLGLVGVFAWFILIALFWAARPLNDRVSVGVDNTLSPPQPVSVAVRCNTLFDNAARDSSPLPPLKAQPAGLPALSYSHTPCASVHRQARGLFVFDAAFSVVAVAALVTVDLRRQRRRDVFSVAQSGV